MKIIKKASGGLGLSNRIVAGKTVAGSIVDYARCIAASKQRSVNVAKKAKIITKSGQLTARYR